MRVKDEPGDYRDDGYYDNNGGDMAIKQEEQQHDDSPHPEQDDTKVDLGDLQALERDAENLLQAIEKRYNAEIQKLKVSYCCPSGNP